MELAQFIDFVNNNSIPTGRVLKGKTDLLKPSIRRIKPPNMKTDNPTESKRLLHEDICAESLAYVFNKSLKDSIQSLKQYPLKKLECGSINISLAMPFPQNNLIAVILVKKLKIRLIVSIEVYII